LLFRVVAGFAGSVGRGRAEAVVNAGGGGVESGMIAVIGLQEGERGQMK
jgi:hypothetical protein